MSMDYGAGYAEVISNLSLSKLCHKEYKAFNGLLNKTKVEGSTLVEFMNEGQDINLLSDITDDDKASELQGKIVDAWVNLQSAFHKCTKGLELNMAYQEPEGSSYDEVKGFYYCVGGMYQLTPAGKKFEKTVQRKFFVTLG
jgi:hypothetical protein